MDLAYRLSSIVVNRIINPLNTTPTYSMADLDELFSQLLDDLESTVLEVVQRFSSSSTDHESMHGFLLRMEEILAYCVAVEDHIVPVYTSFSHGRRFTLQNIRARARGSGRPPLCISEDYIRYLFQNDFSLVDMAHMLGCSTRTACTGVYKHWDSAEENDIVTWLMKHWILRYKASISGTAKLAAELLKAC